MIVEIVRRHQPSGGWGAILDVGCGDGLFFDRLKEFGEIDGVEPDSAIVQADNPHRQHIHIGPFDKSFQPGHKYSLILMLDVLEHLDAPVEALRRGLSLLSPGGLMLITVPAFRVLWSNHDVLNHHRTRYTKSSFRQVARQAGMRILKERYFFISLFPIKLAVRALESLFPAEPKVPTVPPPGINRLLLQVARLEANLAYKLPMPFGTSLFVMGTHKSKY
jgi:predicted TPR repeat methyltransferase